MVNEGVAIIYAPLLKMTIAIEAVFKWFVARFLATRGGEEGQEVARRFPLATRGGGAGGRGCKRKMFLQPLLQNLQ